MPRGRTTGRAASPAPWYERGVWWLGACATRPDPARDPGVEVVLHAAGGTAALRGEPGATVEVRGGDDARTVVLDDRGRAELVGLVGDVTYTVRAGDRVTRARIPGPAGDACPDVDVLAHDPARMPSGWVVIPFRPVNTADSCTLVLDGDLRPRWWWVVEGGASVEDAVFGPDGHVWLRTSEDEIEVRTLQGALVSRWSAAPEGGERALPLGPAGHEVIPRADGSFWAFGQRSTPFLVPVAEGATESRPGVVDDTPVQLVGPDGALLREVDVLAAMQPGRCGWDCLDAYPFGRDFLHGNAIVPLDDGRVLVSVRNQDALVMFDADGAPTWRLGDPLGWDPPWADAFLAPDGPVDWPVHSHGVDYDPATGDLVVFDNHTRGGTPWAPSDDDVARIAWLRVDEAAGTVRQVASFRHTTTGELRAPIMGDADLPRAPGDPLLAVYAWVEGEDGVPNGARGWGDLTSRVVAVDPAAPTDLPLDLRLRLPRRRYPDGGYAYRVQAIDPLAAE